MFYETEGDSSAWNFARSVSQGLRSVERTGLEPVTSALSKQRSKPTELTFLTDKINEPAEINLSHQATIFILPCHYNNGQISCHHTI